MDDALIARLTTLFAELPEGKREMLLEYAEFLHTRHSGAPGPAAGKKSPEMPAPVSAPLDIPRPGEESVVRAIKRLRATYPMLDSAKLLDATSTLMTQHVMQGREVIVVIDELEVLFRRHFEQLGGKGD